MLANDPIASEETNKIAQLLRRQQVMEKNMSSSHLSAEPTECTPPPVCHEFQTARLFLAQFGFLNFDDNDKVYKKCEISRMNQYRSSLPDSVAIFYDK